MPIPWGELGLARFRAVAGLDQTVFDSGKPSAPGPQDVRLPTVIYGSSLEGLAGTGATEAAVFDAHTLARVLHPTLSDHELETVAAAHGISVDTADRARCIGEVFGALIEEAIRLDHEVVVLLVRLLPEPLAALFQQALLLLPSVLAEAEEQGCPESEPGETSPPVTIVGDPLGPTGFVAQGLPSFERREGQIAMSEAVGRTFAEGGALVVEAGPGTGKTFAYLIPAIELLTRDRSARVVVSTRTKQLQEQLYAKDLPFLLRQMAPDLKVALLKGRGNYICLRRWEIAVRELSEGLDRDRLYMLAPLVRWLWETDTGDIDENTAFLSQPGAQDLWAQLCDHHLHCVEPFCPVSEECLSIGARRKARAARLAVVNHSLLLNDVGVARKVIGKYTHLVVDEGHALEESARSAFTATLAPRVLERLADELTPSRRRRVGFIRRAGGGEEETQRAMDLVATMRSSASTVFAAIARDLPPNRRAKTPPLRSDSIERVDRLRAVVENLELAVEELVDGIEDPELKREGEGHEMAVREVADLLARLVSPPDEETVRWYERDRAGLSLYFTPLEVAPILQRMLYPALDAFVLTSATLSIDGDFGFLMRSLGLEEAYEAPRSTTVPSPFSYADSMRLFAPDAFPLPTEDAGSYAERVAELLTILARELNRKGLVLFTSYQMLDDVRARLPEDVLALAQGIDGPRSKIIERFRRYEGGMLLFGTDSFWEGVDLPGDELEYLVITRLPFAVPTDPIQAALGNLVARSGRDPFMDLSLPRAVLRLRQGVGRLIRTRRDRGAVVLVDRRIVAKSYGRTFAAALPGRLERFESPEELAEGLSGWFDGPSPPPSPADRN